MPTFQSGLVTAGFANATITRKSNIIVHRQQCLIGRIIRGGAIRLSPTLSGSRIALVSVPMMPMTVLVAVMAVMVLCLGIAGLSVGLRLQGYLNTT